MTGEIPKHKHVLHTKHVWLSLLVWFWFACVVVAFGPVFLPEFYPFNSRVSCMTITTQQPQCIGVHTYLSRLHRVVVTSSSTLRLPLTSHSGCCAKLEHARYLVYDCMACGWVWSAVFVSAPHHCASHVLRLACAPDYHDSL